VRLLTYGDAVVFDERSRDQATLLGGERVVLEAFLDDMRGLIAESVRGLSDAQTRRRLVSSKTTLLGIVQHCAAIERFFFERTLLGRDPAAIAGRSDATDPSWDLDSTATIANVLADFHEACDESRRISAAFDLDHVTHYNPGRGPLTVRWIYVRMIEELGRHAGHADILREQVTSQHPA
jgi:hypothetical protein